MSGTEKNLIVDFITKLGMAIAITLTMNITNENYTEFKGLVMGDDDQIDLAYAALLIAKTEYPTIDIATYMEQLDDMAYVVHERLKGEISVVQMIFAINDYLFRDQGFAGELDNYYDPRNSFLNDVLDRKRGIPLSLSLLYMEIGKRLGLHLQGVSFPGHFLVRLPVEVGHIVLDPFSGGASLSKDDLVFRLLRRYDIKDDRDELLSKLMLPASNSQILLRMLNNLKSSYIRDQDYQRALNATNYMMAINEHEPEELKDRALLYDKLECPRAAAEDYSRYLEMAPEDEDHEYLRERLICTLREGSLLN